MAQANAIFLRVCVSSGSKPFRECAALRCGVSVRVFVRAERIRMTATASRFQSLENVVRLNIEWTRIRLAGIGSDELRTWSLSLITHSPANVAETQFCSHVVNV